eukprot:GGOE01007741.1.p1 GENE.GGOE01007741.1~~GGOE01007741.1.p1  ORF type:complete len:346 (+),score=71.52 GGOE01007741.1:37-1074(+)
MLGVSKAPSPADIFQSSPQARLEGLWRPAALPTVCSCCGIAAATACPVVPDRPSRAAVALQELLRDVPTAQVHHALQCAEGDVYRALPLLLRHPRPLVPAEDPETAALEEPQSLSEDGLFRCGRVQLDVQRLFEALYTIKGEQESIAWRLTDEGLVRDVEAQWAAIAADMQHDAGSPVDDVGPGYWPKLAAPEAAPLTQRVALSPHHRLHRLFTAALTGLGQHLISVEYLRNPAAWTQFAAAQQSARQPAIRKLYSAPFSNLASICAAEAPVAWGQWLLAGRCPGCSIPGAQSTKGERALFLCRTLPFVQGVRRSLAFEGPIFPELLIVYCPAQPSASPDSLTSA